MYETGQRLQPTPIPVTPRTADADLFAQFEQSYAQFQVESVRAFRRLTALVALTFTLAVIALLS